MHKDRAALDFAAFIDPVMSALPSALSCWKIGIGSLACAIFIDVDVLRIPIRSRSNKLYGISVVHRCSKNYRNLMNSIVRQINLLEPEGVSWLQSVRKEKNNVLKNQSCCGGLKRGALGLFQVLITMVLKEKFHGWRGSRKWESWGCPIIMKRTVSSNH